MGGGGAGEVSASRRQAGGATRRALGTRTLRLLGVSVLLRSRGEAVRLAIGEPKAVRVGPPPVALGLSSLILTSLVKCDPLTTPLEGREGLLPLYVR